jgi:hypothetical protein
LYQLHEVAKLLKEGKRGIGSLLMLLLRMFQLKFYAEIFLFEGVWPTTGNFR